MKCNILQNTTEKGRKKCNMKRQHTTFNKFSRICISPFTILSFHSLSRYGFSRVSGTNDFKTNYGSVVCVCYVSACLVYDESEKFLPPFHSQSFSLEGNSQFDSIS